LSVPSPTDIAIAGLRWLEYAGLLGFIGVVVVRRLAGMPPPLSWARVSMQPALAAAFTGGVAVLIGESLSTEHVSSAVMLRVAAEGIALGLCVFGRPWVVPLAILAVLALPFAGHGAVPHPDGGAIFTDALHILAAGAWGGGILVLATLRPPGGWRGEEGRALLARFGPVAFLAFAATALSGALRAAEVLGSASYLFSTPYGLVLTAKTAGVLVMVAMSAVGWSRGWRFTRWEGVVVLFVLAATALLAAFPMPPIYPIVQLAGR
jgi:putative copper export protein